MPITTSAKKALRNSARKRVFNMRKKEGISNVLKSFRKFIVAKDKAQAEKVMVKLQKAIDKSAKTGLIKKNTASRKKSRLHAMIKKLG